MGLPAEQAHRGGEVGGPDEDPVDPDYRQDAAVDNARSLVADALERGRT
ncbi:hypothetical protein [Brachybacterium sacelli]|uniref:Uncharacterized protein n=1 Tax=Brachybacterium sacelli TaxID=173364 RepID=A0ABS4WVA0_9MICO|nr:hypothetical protein [Brachybacterium sacelli]MBP2380127.1 hypothetical protein [Brachybacterium sacelli]